MVFKRRLLSGLLLVFVVAGVPAQERPILYLMAGQGSDGRVFDRLDLQGYETRVLEALVPERGERMAEYAARMSRKVDPSRSSVLVGVSFGGMVAIEMAEILSVDKVIVISSAKQRSELPPRYRALKYAPLHRALGGRFYSLGARVARPVFEPAARPDGAFFQDMVSSKDPRFVRRAMHCIATWERVSCPPGVFHIHGTADHTLPIRNMSGVIAVPEGSHMMIYLRAAEISRIILAILEGRLSPSCTPADSGGSRD